MADLEDHLDSLYHDYLKLLDKYVSRRESLSKSFALGHLSLSKANFRIPASQARYGSDYYDSRMKASRFLSPTITPLVNGTETFISYPSTSEEDLNVSDSTISSDASVDGKNEQRVTQVDPSDPIKWFGILVPPELRHAQSAFQESVSSHLPALAAIDSEMKAVEIEIRRTRKKILRQLGSISG